MNTKVKPKVDEAALFREIAFDFCNPLDAVREAISNAFDANATSIGIKAYIHTYKGDRELILEFTDNGEGMQPSSSDQSIPTVSSFFDLGHSTRRQNPEKIGRKGHGTKTFFNSRQIELETYREGKKIYALMDEPKSFLSKKEVPPYEYEEKSDNGRGTKITLYGYNRNRTNGFSHDELKDFILWFTKFGSIELQFDIDKFKNSSLNLQGVDHDNTEPLPFGHVFGKEEHDFRKLKERDAASPTKYFVKKWSEKGVPVKGFPDIKTDMVFYIEGDKAKGYNPMLRRQGRPAREGMYTVEERYGLWLCKDYIPIQQVSDWISQGQRAVATKYHAFVNCQGIELTANRGDTGNTDAVLLEAINETIVEWNEQKILKDPQYKKYEEELERENIYRDPEQEKKELETRKKRAKGKKTFSFKKPTNTPIELIEPRQEAGVYALFCTMHAMIPDLFAFRIVDYDTHKGYDALVLSKNPTTGNEEYKFVEFKKTLETEFNHTFNNLATVICWECNLGDETEVTDINGEKRILKITKPDSGKDYTKYILRSDTAAHNIEVYVLKDYLKEKCGIDFRPKTAN